MSKLNVDQKTIKDLFQDKNADFLIPDYQRPYAWKIEECQTLWDDVFAFAIPDSDATKFDDNSEYFLGPIVTFKNEKNQKEIIDGQQRLTTIMLLLRAFYEKFGMEQDDATLVTKKNIEQCIWKTNMFEQPNKEELKINSEVATDNDNDEFVSILKEGVVKKEMKSNYTKNYKFFLEQIDEFKNTFPVFFAYLPTRIMRNCILLPIEAESQDTALRIFSTLNDRGKPLSDADIFKAQFYKYYSQKGQKDEFMKRWKMLEEICNKIFQPISWTPMDEIFSRYMYYERAKIGTKSSTTEALRKFYEKDSYKLLKDDETLKNLEVLAEFWKDISLQNRSRFSDNVLRCLFVLNYAPNSMWTYFLSVYFMSYRDENNNLDQEKLCSFLEKSIGFIFAYAVSRPGVNALRTPVYTEMVNVVNKEPVTFENFLLEKNQVRNQFDNFSFSNNKTITKSMIVWWAYQNKSQEIYELVQPLDIEHIFPKNRYEKEKILSNDEILEMLGNKAILESNINISASDYKFADKKKYYNGFVTAKGIKKDPTKNVELHELAKTKEDFGENEIIARNKQIMDAFIDYLRGNELLKE